MRKYFRLYYLSKLVFPVAIVLLILHAFHSKTIWSQDAYYISAGNFILLVLLVSEIRNLHRLVLDQDSGGREKLYPTKPIYNKDELPRKVEEWPRYRRADHCTIRARYIAEPFNVETSEGIVGCKEGYIALDSRGIPYPIATEEFDNIYQAVESQSGTSE